MANTIFITYQFEGAPYSADTSYGHSTAIHCNYIEKIVAENLTNSTISLIFDNNEFPFLADTTTDPFISGGTGWTAWKINAIMQIVNATGDTVVADPANWKLVDITEHHDLEEALQRTFCDP